MLPVNTLRSGFAPQQPRFRKCCASGSRSPCANGPSQLVPLPHGAKRPLRHVRWRCRSTVDSSRPAPGNELARSGDTPDAQSATPSTHYAKDAAADGRRKGLALMEELKELVKSSNSELKAELLQQFALLQQADVEAKRRQEHDHSTSVSMHGSILGEIEEMRQQLGSVISSRDSTQQLLRQVLGEVQELRLQQQQVDSRTAEAVQHAMAAAASAEAVQRQQGALSDEIKATVGAAAAALAAASQQVAIKEAVTAASEAASTALGQAVGGKEGTAGRQQEQQPQQQQQQTPTLQQLIDTAKIDDEEDVPSGMCNNAIRAAAHAIRKGMAADDMAKYIRDRFDSVYGKYWQCVVVQGGVAGRAQWHEEEPIRMVVGGWTVYLWKSDSEGYM